MQLNIPKIEQAQHATVSHTFQITTSSVMLQIYLPCLDWAAVLLKPKVSSNASALLESEAVIQQTSHFNALPN